MRVAVLGAGSVGACAALELAQRGHDVDLYDENPEPIAAASRNNEGKIHLGLVYAKDRSLKTATTMIHGALRFSECLGRWIDLDAIEDAISTPYFYAVHRETMTTVDELDRYYRECRRLFDDAVAASGLAYLGSDRSLLVEKLPGRTHEDLVSSEEFVGAFRTSERGIDPRVIADHLCAAVHAAPRIRFVGGARVTDAAWSDADALKVTFAHGGESHVEEYGHVVNALWNGRLEIDAKLGLIPERSWLYRYKMAGWIDAPVAERDVPSLTMVLGPFGDVVNYGGQGVYFSWYPTGLAGHSGQLRPPDWTGEMPATERESIVRESYRHLAHLCPALGRIDFGEGAMRAIGGVIFAWGAADIDREESELHTRYEIGVHSVRNYHSVNTGKYTMAPLLACEAADRVTGEA